MRSRDESQSASFALDRKFAVFGVALGAEETGRGQPVRVATGGKSGFAGNVQMT